uniref:Vps53 N-terminal domain-containing protein n=1 Tax=Odontella aurita TaxID=265563 RepID=A0A7S4J134_9STRA
MPPAVLADACLVVEALGLPTRREFVDLFCSDHLETYAELFDPRKSPSASAAAAAEAAKEATAPKPSFKIKIPTGSSHGSSSMFDDDEDSRPAASVNQNPSSLDQVDRRYAWYRRTLRDVFDDKFRAVFPRGWNVPHALTSRFLSVTGDHLLLLLAPGRNCRDRDCENVTVLLKALQKTILFEKEMTAWLTREYGAAFAEAAKEGADEFDDEDNIGGGGGADGERLEFDEDGRAVAAGSAEGIRIKYERMKRERAERGGEVDGDDEEEDEPAFASGPDKAVPVKPLVGIASSSFDRYMGPYIGLEEQNMDEQLAESTSDMAVDTRGELPVFTSSTALFVYIKNSITRCTALTRGRTFYQLYAAFQDTLKKYASVLGGKLPSRVTTATGVNLGVSINLSAVGGGASGVGGGGGGVGGGGGTSGGAAGGASALVAYRIPEGEEVTVCHVIDTCEYCADTVEALEDLIRDKIDDDYKDKIDMTGEQEAFHDVTARSLRVLVSGLEVRTNEALREMSSKNWATMDSVGEESAYVRKVHGAVQPFVATVRGLIPPSYFRNFCDKYAAAFTSGFYNSIVRLKRISESGTQQLLLDVYNLKTLLLKLPVIETDKGKGKSSSSPHRGRGTDHSSAGSTIPPAMYTKMVTRQFTRIEILLKVVGTPPDLLIDVFKAHWEGGSALDLQTVMNLKGMRRAEQAAMLEKFGVDPETAAKGAAAGAAGSNILNEGVQSLQDKTSDVSAKVNSELSQMREKVDNFRKAFR